MRQLTTFLLICAVTVWPYTGTVMALADYEEAPMVEQGLSAESLAIVVNRSNPVVNLTSAELHTIFLGGRTYWTNGRRITLVMREPGDPERKTILKDVCGMNEEQFKAHFIRGLYSGEIQMSPKILETPSGVRRFIFNVPGAIGYLRLSDVDSNVRVIRINEMLPDDKGYRLHVQSQAAN